MRSCAVFGSIATVTLGGAYPMWTPPKTVSQGSVYPVDTPAISGAASADPWRNTSTPPTLRVLRVNGK